MSTKPGDEVESEHDGRAVDGGFPFTGGDARLDDGGPDPPGFVDIELRAVKAAEVVDAGGHVLDGVVGLEVEALVCLLYTSDAADE